MADPFATPEEFSTFTGAALPDDLSRELFMLEQASSLIRAFCHQTLSFVAYDVVTVYPTVSTLLTLPERPVAAVAKVVVAGSETSNYYVVPRGIRSGTVSSPGAAWTSGATVTYSHGYQEDSEEFQTIKGVCISAASRAYFMNKINAAGSVGSSEAYGEMLMETRGYGPEIFLTQGEKQTLTRFKRGPVR